MTTKPPRGRPPKPDAPTPSERASAALERLVKAGGRRLEIKLSPEAAKALDKRLTKGPEKTATAVIEALLIDATRPL
jgi:hypothetical protein